MNEKDEYKYKFRTDEELKKFMIESVDVNVELSLRCLEADRGIMRDDIIDAAADVVLFIKHRVKSSFNISGIDYVNIAQLIQMMLFSSSIKAHDDVIKNEAEKRNMSKEQFIDGLKEAERIILKDLPDTNITINKEP